jgi:hypothetical protein
LNQNILKIKIIELDLALHYTAPSFCIFVQYKWNKPAHILSVLVHALEVYVVENPIINPLPLQVASDLTFVFCKDYCDGGHLGFFKSNIGR